METYSWYAALIKPAWAPPSWLFGPVWSVLYILIFVSFAYVFYKAFRREVPLLIATPFVINLLANFAFTPIQFGLQNNLLAAIDVTIIWLSLIVAMRMIWPYYKWVVYCNIPYLVWVSFATLLQFTITYLNW